VRIGTKAPDFNLPDVDGEIISLRSLAAGKTAVVVIFTCNHCPYSIAYTERLKKIQSQYLSKGVVLVGINPDSEDKHPEDTLEDMKKYAVERNLNFHYLRDKTGETAMDYDAKVIPEAFLVDASGTIRYSGRIDDCWQSAKRVKRHDLKEALEDILHERDVAVKTTPPIGCAIKRE
jgi:peroxiredoxin